MKIKFQNKDTIVVFFSLVLYVVAPNPIKLVLLILLSLLVFQKPSIAAVILIVTPIFDIHYIIPYADRSITLVVFPIAILSMFLFYNFSKSMYKVLPLLVILFLIIIYATAKGYTLLDDYSGFNDPSRGIVFIISLIYLFLILNNNKTYELVQSIREMMWIVPIVFVVSLPLSFFLYTDNISQLRFQGTFGDPNYFARYALISMLISIFLIEKKLYKIILTLIILVFILLSASKSASLVIVLMFFYFVFKSDLRYKYLWLSLVPLLIIGLSFTEIPNLLISRFNIEDKLIMKGVAVTNKLDVLSTGRTFLWRYFIENFNIEYQYFFLGGGIGSSSSFFEPLLGANIAAHNSFIEVLLDLGLIGTIVLFFVLSKLLLYTKIKGIDFIIIHAYLIIIFLFYNFTLSGFWSKQNIGLIFLIILSYGYKRKSLS